MSQLPSSLWLVGSVLALAGCATSATVPPPPTPEVTPSPDTVESQTQPLIAEEAPHLIDGAVGPQDGLGSYTLRIEDEGGQAVDGELEGEQGLELTIASDGEGLTAECRGTKIELSGSVEGGHGAPLTVSLMGLSTNTEQPVAIRLMSDAGSSDHFSGVAVVERNGTASSVRFVASRRHERARHRARPPCGDLLWSHKSLYHGPAGSDELVTRRFERCTEHAPPVSEEPAAPPR